MYWAWFVTVVQLMFYAWIEWFIVLPSLLELLYLLRLHFLWTILRRESTGKIKLRVFKKATEQNSEGSLCHYISNYLNYSVLVTYLQADLHERKDVIYIFPKLKKKRIIVDEERECHNRIAPSICL